MRLKHFPGQHRAVVHSTAEHWSNLLSVGMHCTSLPCGAIKSFKVLYLGWLQLKILVVFKASALWANAFYKSNVRLSVVCLSVRLFVCVFTFEVPFKRLCAPTSQSQMSNIFRHSESLGKSNGKKWSQI